jgi:ComF family protein
MAYSFKLYSLIWVGLDWLFPPHCAGCGTQGFRWCEECQADSPLASNKHCVFCRKNLRNQGVCVDCAAKNRNLDRVYSWGIHDGPLRQALHKLKYKRDIGLGEVLAQNMVALIKRISLPVDIVVPIPLGRKRMRERGYNQSALLAKPMAFSLGVDYQPAALKRVKETRTQVGLNIKQRRENVAGAFEARQKAVDNRRVLLVDDVMTTGATLEAAAKALKHSGAAQVWSLTLAQVSKSF